MEHTKTPLTQNQKLIWIGQELNPLTPIYNMVMTYQVKGVVLFSEFEAAFQKLVASSDAFRSVFETENEIVYQKYLPSVECKLEFIDFSNDENPSISYNNWLEERTQLVFDLQKKAFDSVLIKCAKENYIWYINQHHLITDGWSSSLAFSKIANYYTQQISVKANNTAEEKSYLFKDFATKAQEIETTSAIIECQNYWKNKLKDYSINPKLYHSNSKILKTNSKRITLNLGKDRTDKLLALANQKGVRVWTLDLTLYNVFLTALFAYVYRISDQEKLVIGSPSHNRTSKSFQKTIGFFVEIFPLMAEIEAEETFSSLLKKIQVESNSFLKNAKTGSSSSEVNRKFNVFFNYMLNTSNSNFNHFDVHTNWIHPGHTDPRHHLRLHVHDLDNTGEIKLYFDINTSVFNDNLQQNIPQHFLNIFDAFIGNANQKIKTTAFVTTGEVSKIKEWNNTHVNFDVTETLLTKFKKQVQATPKNRAISFNENHLSYAEFHEKSNQVARFIEKQGVVANDIIAVSFDRSLEMMIYLYGIIKAGAAYLPIDPKTPYKRVAYILDNSKSKALFYNHEEFEDLEIKGVPTYSLKQIQNSIEAESTADLATVVSPQNLAYVIYTSGSTGNPKGVKISHKAICNRLQWMSSDYPVNALDVFLQKTPITFDVSVWELFWPLQTGAKLVVEIPDGHKNPEQLIQTIQKNKVTQIHFVPSMLSLFSNTEEVYKCKSLKRIFCSGEALPSATIQKTYEQLNEVEIHNLYGPTEAAIDVSSWYCDPQKVAKGVPIGKPVANTQLYILDENLNQLPIGLPGELHIGGVQLAEGYLNSKELTAKKFVTSKCFPEKSQSTLYKTGDLARYREDGDIEYLGRIDTQVKLRGLRIELGEIESHLEQIKEVSKAVVIVDVDKQVLVAYYTGTQVNQNDLEGILITSLPEYMIPSTFVHINSFAYLSSGKVNRKVLSLPEKESKQYSSPKTAPVNEFEELVLEVWKEVLQLESIGTNENFIRLGGDSLQAISITSRLKKVLQLEVTITDVFEYPTIKAYAANVEQTILKLMNDF